MLPDQLRPQRPTTLDVAVATRRHSQSVAPEHISAPRADAPHICLFGEENLSVLAPEYATERVGGEQVQQTLLARALRRHGYRVSMITHDYGQPDGAYWEGIQVFKTSRPHAGIPGIRFLHPRWTAMWNACQRANADVYYTSCAGFHVGLLALYAQRSGTRLLFRTAHDADCDPDNLLIRFWRDKQLYEYGLRRAQGVLTQTQRQHDTLLANYGVQSRVAVMLIDEPSQRYAFTKRTCDVLWVNNFRDFKNPHAYLEVAERLRHLSCHMIGGRVAEAPALYETCAARARTLDNVTFHGKISYRDVNEYYARARVLVSTSVTEGFPNSYLQAWARGTPVVAFFDPDGVIARYGLGAVVDSVDGMVTAVRSLATSLQLWKACSERCREYMAKEYSEPAVIRPYLELIEQQVIERRRVPT